MRRLLYFSLVLVAAYFLSLPSALFKGALRVYCRSVLKSELQYEQLTLNRYAFRIDKPHLEKTKGGRLFAAEAIAVHYSPNWSTKSLDCYVQIVEPELDFIQGFQEFHLLLNTFSQRKPFWMSVHGSLMVESGKLLLPSKQEPCSFDFIAEKWNDVDTTGCLALSFENTNEHMILAGSSHVDGSWKADLCFENLKAQSLTPLFDLAFPPSKEWVIEEGTLNGAFKVERDLKRSLLANGKGQLSDFVFAHHAWSCKGSSPLLHFELNTDTSKKIVGRFLCEKKGYFSLGKQIDVEVDRFHGTSFDFETSQVVMEGNLQTAKGALPIELEGIYRHKALCWKIEAEEEGLRLLGKNLFDENFMSLHCTKEWGGETVCAFAQVQKRELCYGIHGTLENLPDHALFGLELSKKNLKMQNGWLNGKNLPIEKYFTPYLFQDKSVNFEGKADVYATFNDRHLDLTYHLQHLKMETPYFLLEAKEWQKEKATHHFNFRDNHPFGFLPLSKATFLEKSSGLLFNDISAQVNLEPHQIHCKEVAAKCCDIPFFGSVDLNYEKGYQVEVRAEKMEASVAQLNDLFKKPSLLQKFPLKGNVKLRNKGAVLKVSSNDLNIKTEVEGCLTKGKLESENKEATLGNLSAEFSFSQEKLDITSIRGDLLFKEKSFSLVDGSIHFKDLVFFDLPFEGREKTLFRLCGQTTPLNEKSIDVTLDPEKSCFDKIHPSQLTLKLQDGLKVASFQMEAKLPLRLFDAHWRRFSLEKVEGDLNVHCHFEDTFHYRLTSQNLSINHHPFDHLLLEGKKQHDTWSLDLGELDECTFSADLTPKEESWKIDFLGLRCKESLLLGMEGEYFNQSGILKGKINLFEAHLAKLESISFLKPLVENYSPKGIVHAQGPFQIEPSKGITLENIESRWSDENETRLVAKMEKGEYDFEQREFVLHNVDFETPYDPMGWHLPSFPFTENLKGRFHFKGRLDQYLAKMEIDPFLTLEMDPSECKFAAKYQNFELHGTAQTMEEGEFTLTHEEAKLKGVWERKERNKWCFHQLQLKDVSGTAQAEVMTLEQQRSGHWFFSIPLLTCCDFRPSESSSFIVKNMNVKNLKGALSDPSSFSGTGRLNFSHLSKKRENSLLAKSSDLIHQFGLDVTPSKGVVDFEIKEKQICFTHFTDVYSEGKIWQFSLPSSKNRSYVDFDGNLNLQLRMKQTKPVLKFTEQFTFHLKGPYEKPTCSIERFKPREKEVAYQGS